ncbi:uncharacterized protein LOC126381998 isoform X1 [Pectinophora gossypiella]|uniref:uncharacterized protein LOC126381998 isoform X1 n=1 Tax=Pectinophora gossypiella TaxID=13191 RepID=UPI00214EBA42|nr:uncharacterized protein LOC126381998 isoform X1 [Pectinophora gossypiella]
MSVEVNKELNELTVKRRSVKGRITKFSNFDDLQSRIEVYNEDNLDDELQEREEIEDSFHSNIAFAKVKLGTISLAETSGQAERESATYTPNDSQCAHSCGGQQDLGFRLPVIQISNFDANPVNFEQVNRGLHCFVCKGKHRIYDCPAFLSMSIEERIQKASSLKLCLNCLRSGHIAGACSTGESAHQTEQVLGARGASDVAEGFGGGSRCREPMRDTFHDTHHPFRRCRASRLQ